MNILFAGNYKLNESKKKMLEAMGVNLYIMQDEQAEIPINPEEVEGIVANWLFVNHDIKKFTNLKYIQLLSAGLDRVPMEYVNKNNIQIHNARGVYSVPMAEMTICGILQLIKNSKTTMENQKSHKWVKQRDLGELSNKTACVLGLGSVGCEVAKRLSVFCETIIGIDVVEINNHYVHEFYTIDNIENIINRADVVVITVPLTENTRYMFNSKIFDQMKETAIIVNVARGAIVNEKDLILAIKSGKIAGAVLDVFEEEPLNENSEIWDMPQVVVTPHQSFVSELNEERLWNLIINNLKTYINGE